MRKIVLMFSICILCFGCREKQSTDDGILEVKGTSAGNPCVIHVGKESLVQDSYSSFIDLESVEVIPLEITDESILAGVTKLLVQDSMIYVLDHKQNTVFAFTDKGKYVNKIDKYGRGPGGYTMLMDFCVEDGWIGMLNFDYLSFYHFDYPDSVRTLKTDSVNVCGVAVYADADHYYLRPSNIRNIKASVIVCDKNLQVETILTEPKFAKFCTVEFPPFFIPMEDKLYYYQTYNDTIYQITDTTLLAAYVFDGEGKHFSDEEILRALWKGIPMQGNGMFDFQNVYYADSVISFLANDRFDQYYGYYSLRSHQLKLIPFANRKDDIFNLKLKWNPQASTPDGYFYSVIRRAQLDYLKVKPKPDSPLAVLTEDSNPVIIRYKLKKF